MTPTEVKQAADEMVEMFRQYAFYDPFISDKYRQETTVATRISINHCERVIDVLMDVHSQMWGMEDAIRVTANEINTHRLILSELEGRVK